MKGILIDPENKVIKEVDHPDTLQGFYNLLDCNMIESAFYLKNGDCLYCDEEGLFKEEKHFFIMRESPFQPITGKAIVVGTGQEGDTVDCKSTLEEIKNQVTFLTTGEALDLAW